MVLLNVRSNEKLEYWKIGLLRSFYPLLHTFHCQVKSKFIDIFRPRFSRIPYYIFSAFQRANYVRSELTLFNWVYKKVAFLCFSFLVIIAVMPAYNEEKTVFWAVKETKKYVDKVIKSRKPVRVQDYRAGIWNDNILYPVCDVHGKVVRIAVLARDITERIQIQENYKKLRKN